jgi:hypothetical protein
MSYSEDLTALLPLLMYRRRWRTTCPTAGAISNHPATHQRRSILRLFYSVICAEDAPVFSHDDDDDQAYFFHHRKAI